jgi:peroxiredoxin
MKKLLTALALMISVFVQAGGYDIGDKATDFKLKNIDGKMISMADYSEARGFIVIFTCNNCPYAIAYEDRIIEMDKKYKALGYPVIAINPNDPDVQPGDSYDAMQERAAEKGFTFPYLYDKDQSTYPIYGATRTPHVYVLNKEDGDLVVRYIGTIDDNYADASAVKEKYLANAVDALIAGNDPDPATTKAIGCSIKKK